MGKLIDILVTGNKDSLDDSEFKDLDHTNSALKSEAKTELKITTVSTKSDMLNVEQAIRSGDALIMEVENLTSGLTKEELLNYLHETVNEVNGDIVQRHSSEFIITPSSITISRSKL